MNKNTPPNTQKHGTVLPVKNHEDASSEMIGSIILIGLFVAVFGVILVSMTSSSSEFVVPAVVIEAAIDWDKSTYVLNLRSGDTLRINETIILVDGKDETGNFTYSGSGQVWTLWGSGESLTLDINGKSVPTSVQIIYYESLSGNGILLWDPENSVPPDPPTGLKPKAEFDADPMGGDSPLYVEFIDRSSNSPNAWRWSFGDGTGSSAQNPPIHFYNAPGNYTVQLTAYNVRGSDTVTKYILVSDPSVSDFTVDFIATPLSGAESLMVTFTDLTSGTPTAWEWDFGDGSPTSDRQNPLHTYQISGTYTVTLNATVNGVTKTEQKPAFITVTPNCIPGLYGTYFDKYNEYYWEPFSGTPMYRIDPRLRFADFWSTWSSDEFDWPLYSLGKSNSFSVTYDGYLKVPENGTYTFYLSSDDGSVLWIDDIADTDTVFIDNWGEHPVETVTKSTYLTQGRHPIRVKMTQDSGRAVLWLEWKYGTMKNPVPIEAFCHIPAVDFTARPVSGVVPLEVKFTALSIGDMTSWNWDFGDGTTSTERNPVHTYTAPGVYSVVLVGSDGTRSYSEDKSDYIYVTTGCLPGLFGTYYDNYKDQAYTVPFTGNKYTRIDPRIWFADKESKRESDINDWPKPTLTKTEKFSVEYEGFIIIPKDDTYTFHLTSDDGSVLWIGNTANTDPVLINNWGEHAYFTVSADKYLTKGKHPIRIKMTENKEAAVLHFEWESASIPRQPVESFCHGSGTLPIADFVAEPLDGLKPLNVQFTDRSTGSTMTSWLWNFGDGTTSTQQNPMHTYTSAGDYTVQLKAKNPYGENTRVKTGYIHVEEKLTAGFKATPLSGFAPLMVTFTDQTTGVPTSWHWDFGDGTTSTERNPVHTYASAGTYSVNLTVTNAYESDTLQRTNYIKVSVPFGDYIVDENILLYGNKLIFRGKTLNGPDATIHITGNTLGSDTLGGNAQISVSNIYVNGPINWNSGSGILGSAAKPGTIYVDGGLTLTGVIEVYGNVSVNGKFLLKNSVIHGNVYVNGDLELGWGAPNLDDANVYYTGAFTYPTGMGNGVLNKCVKVASIPEFVVPSYTMPSVKTDSWYTSNGYASSGALKSNVKIAANSYTPNNYQLPATNVIIVAKTGNINLGQNGGGVVTGILFAPNGKVILKDKSFEGVVIAKEFEVLDGSNVVTFKNLNQYIGNPANYPF